MGWIELMPRITRNRPSRKMLLRTAVVASLLGGIGVGGTYGLARNQVQKRGYAAAQAMEEQTHRLIREQQKRGNQARWQAWEAQRRKWLEDDARIETRRRKQTEMLRRLEQELNEARRGHEDLGKKVGKVRKGMQKKK